jgi:hypothetical protein
MLRTAIRSIRRSSQIASTFSSTVHACLFLCFAAAVASMPCAHGQYKDYPQTAGKVQSIVVPEIPHWVSFDLEARERSEGQSAMAYTAGDSNGYELTRVRGGMTVAPVKWANLYMQFHDTHALALPLSETASNMRDNFDFRQAYLRVHVKSAEIVAGRQELKFGGERLIGISDWTDVSRTFDAIRGHIGTVNRLDLFTASVVTIHPTGFDMHAGGLNFHGAHGVIGTVVPHTTIEPYLYVKRMPSVKSQQNIYGTETEFTPGIRASGNLPFGFDYITEGALQRGSYSNNSIHSGAGYVKVGYSPRIPWHPRIQAERDYATGNPHTNTQRISTFDQLYPSGHNVFGLVDLFGWQNIKQTRINLDLNPARHLTFLLQEEFLTVANLHDSVYSGSGSATIKPPTAGFATDDIGKGFDASFKYVIHGYLVVNGGVGHFFPGALMTQNKHSAPQTIPYLSVTYRMMLGSNRPKD